MKDEIKYGSGYDPKLKTEFSEYDYIPRNKKRDHRATYHSFNKNKKARVIPSGDNVMRIKTKYENQKTPLIYASSSNSYPYIDYSLNGGYSKIMNTLKHLKTDVINRGWVDTYHTEYFVHFRSSADMIMFKLFFE